MFTPSPTHFEPFFLQLARLAPGAFYNIVTSNFRLFDMIDQGPQQKWQFIVNFDHIFKCLAITLKRMV